ncbi:MAG: hypothetical protein QNJ12_03225 [Ilumatobacter sp.]|uniref:hypothetical protein n=1 Tax=Ilumatobacter sp. TaxID=1967498 RepID=UPI002601EC27|nr:hypothetical protein [Ilumatobacter sp.]MDJ0767772.1 hypothetical protein [Ilumatobacter sp.]
MRVMTAIICAGTLLVTGACGGDDEGDEPAGSVPVVEAIDDAPSGEFTLVGLLFDDGGGLVMCDALAESFPPQCPGERVVIANPDAVTADFTEAEGVRWTDSPASLRGTLVDGEFQVAG